MYQFKAKDSEIKPYLLCSGNISSIFSVDHNPVSTSDILDIHRYLMKEK